MRVNARFDPIVKSGVVIAASGNPLRTAAKQVWSWSQPQLALSWGSPGHLRCCSTLESWQLGLRALPYLKCGGDPAVFISISRRSSSLGCGAFLSFKPPKGPGTSISGDAEMCLLLAILVLPGHFSPRGYQRGPNWDMVWRGFEGKFSLCFRGVNVYFLGVIVQKDMLEFKKWF